MSHLKLAAAGAAAILSLALGACSTMSDNAAAKGSNTSTTEKGAAPSSTESPSAPPANTTTTPDTETPKTDPSSPH